MTTITFARHAVALATSIALSTASVLPAAADTFRLRIGAGHPPTLAYVIVASDYFVPEVERRVAEETEHRVRFIEAWSGSVARLTEVAETTSNGLLDIGIAITPFEQSRLYLLTYSYWFPFTSPDPIVQTRVAARLMEENPALAASVEPLGLELLAQSVTENYGIGTVEPWSELSDLAGRRFAAAGSNAPWIEAVDGVVVQMGLGENYTAMQTGLIDGNVIFASPMEGFRLYEVSEQFTDAGFGSFVSTAMLVNAETMDGLPPEVQAIIREVADEWSLRVGQMGAERQAAMQETLVGHGMTWQVLRPEQKADWAARLVDVPNMAAQEANALGLPGTEVFRDYMRILAEEGHEFPVEYVID